MLSQLVPTGVVPRCVPQLKAHGVDLPAVVYHAAEQLRASGAQPLQG